MKTRDAFHLPPASIHPFYSPNPVPSRVSSTPNPPSDIESSNARAHCAVAWAQNRNFRERYPSEGLRPLFPSPVSPLPEESRQPYSVNDVHIASECKSSAPKTKSLKMQYLLLLLACILIGTIFRIQNLGRQLDEQREFNAYLISYQEALQAKNTQVLVGMRRDSHTKYMRDIENLRRIHELELEK
jgi:hypothetical protein